eukprot:1143557-Pelagomonas_calceolata.AAC.1
MPTSLLPLGVLLKARILLTARFVVKGTHGSSGPMCLLFLNEHSAPATATPPPSKVRHPSQLLPEQRHIHLVEVKHCIDTRPRNQLEASKQQHRDLCCHLSRGSAQVTLHTIL